MGTATGTLLYISGTSTLVSTGTYASSFTVTGTPIYFIVGFLFVIIILLAIDLLRRIFGKHSMK